MTTSEIFVLSLMALFAFVGIILGHKAISPDSFGDNPLLRMGSGLAVGCLGVVFGYLLAQGILFIPFVVIAVTVIIVTFVVLELLLHKKEAAQQREWKANDKD